jgi:hypothetical protein
VGVLVVRTLLLLPLLVILLGISLAVAGVAILLGPGWALVAAGAGLVGFGLLADLAGLAS